MDRSFIDSKSGISTRASDLASLNPFSSFEKDTTSHKKQLFRMSTALKHTFYSAISAKTFVRGAASIFHSWLAQTSVMLRVRVLWQLAIDISCGVTNSGFIYSFQQKQT